MSNQARLIVTIIGRVQGVGFRMFVADQARRLGLAGYVRNHATDHRQIEVVAEGLHPALESLLILLGQGPPGARVEALQTGWQAAQGNFMSFRITF